MVAAAIETIVVVVWPAAADGLGENRQIQANAFCFGFLWTYHIRTYQEKESKKVEGGSMNWFYSAGQNMGYK